VASRGGAYGLLERARFEPPDRGRVNVVAARYIRLRLARSEPLERFLALMGRELRWTAETHATSLCARPALACARANKLALKFRKPAEHRQHQSTVRRRRIRPL